MSETRLVVDPTPASGPLPQPNDGDFEAVTERTKLLRQDGILPKPAKPVEHFRNIDRRRFWVLFGTIIFGNTIAFFDSTLMFAAHPIVTSYFGSSNSASWLSTVDEYRITTTIWQSLGHHWTPPRIHIRGGHVLAQHSLVCIGT
jgi:hypothetical protein